MDASTARAYYEKLRAQNFHGYKLTELLGYGKSAAVMKATSSAGDTFAVKVFDTELLERFGKEVQLGRIQRELTLAPKPVENLVGIVEGGLHQYAGIEYPFLVMEYVPGETLSDFVRSKGPQPESFVLETLNTLLRICNDLLVRGVVHRDIKPDNIIISESSHLTLMDLAVMKVLAADDLTDGMDEKPFIGTLRYAPPEFLLREEESENIDAWRAVNIYQIGGVLYDMVMGHRLFGQYREPYARLVIAVQKEIPEVRRNDFTYLTQQLIRNMLAKEWHERLRLFDSIKLESLGKTGGQSAAVLDRIRKVTSEFAQKELEISAARAAADELRKEKEALYSDMLLTIKDSMDSLRMENLVSESKMLYSGAADTQQSSAACVCRLSGTISQGYAEPIDIVFRMKLEDSQLVHVELVGVAFSKRFRTSDVMHADIMALMDSIPSGILCFEGVYDKGSFREAITLKELDVVGQAIEQMAPIVRRKQKFEADIVGQRGVFSAVYSTPQEFVIHRERT
jgi:serine/threonine protein kinase